VPQLLNVLRGEMSLVGPRPHAPNTKAGGRLFPDAVADYALRYRVKPGITGWAQINGYRGETRTREQIEQRVAYDLFYIENWSLILDFKILVLTATRELNSKVAF
jgi:lipopolysaccharide/colanic/teichoic acid biosynthesis glycosyltransferase